VYRPCGAQAREKRLAKKEDAVAAAQTARANLAAAAAAAAAPQTPLDKAVAAAAAKEVAILRKAVTKMVKKAQGFQQKSDRPKAWRVELPLISAAHFAGACVCARCAVCWGGGEGASRVCVCNGVRQGGGVVWRTRVVWRACCVEEGTLLSRPSLSHTHTPQIGRLRGSSMIVALRLLGRTRPSPHSSPGDLRVGALPPRVSCEARAATSSSTQSSACVCVCVCVCV
jgi:hypothetical protein